ncbi:hypothetical protein FHX37_0047 [Haloactinospora alba]|uniref:Uncharacterized protein n=1 Tax=Haloactinospora alba TaxID=405555 RepID=A0A543NED8_9ACTN|nr:hypothetical protein [Haloactinospora alba]TQN30186.1 hypothetical protein FHX37_0047 [Haloactinospora alba]
MKFELVTPDDGGEPAPEERDGDGTPDGMGPDSSGEEEQPGPAARVREAMARVTSSVSRDAALAGQAVGSLLERVERQRSLAGSGQTAAEAPVTFRPHRFTASEQRTRTTSGRETPPFPENP